MPEGVQATITSIGNDGEENETIPLIKTVLEEHESEIESNADQAPPPLSSSADNLPAQSSAPSAVPARAQVQNYRNIFQQVTKMKISNLFSILFLKNVL